jgi:predicted TIM-barrel fold metal-dependent hydrolase
MAEYFRGNPSGKSPMEYLGRPEPIRPEYRDRDARLRQLDDHGLSAAWLFPTLGMIYEEPLHHDPEAVTLLFTAFNRWLLDDWGFDHEGRLFAAPYLTLADCDWACRELEWAVDHGARTVVMRPAAPTTASGPRSPAAAEFDPFWARVQEAGITVVVHAGDSGYTSHGYARDGFGVDFSGIPQPIKMLHMERSIEDFLSSLVCDNLFHRFPALRVASVENGSKFLRGLFDKLRITARKMAGWFPEDPVETFRRHVWVNPFWEDDLGELVDLMGADRVIFGSDWPHIEALPEPLDYLAEVQRFDDKAQRLIMLDNTAGLNEPKPVPVG